MTHLVILARGSGSQLWPLSTPEYPKDFVDILGCGRTLLQLTVDLFQEICSLENTWVVTLERFAWMVQKQLPDLPWKNILTEPEDKGTATALTWACGHILQKDLNADVIVTSSNGVVTNSADFQHSIIQGLNFVTDRELFLLDPLTFHLNTFCSAILRYQPTLTHQIIDLLYSHDRSLSEIYPQCEALSIQDAVLVPAARDGLLHSQSVDFEWHELNTWQSVYELLQKDANQNVSVGPIHFQDSQNNLVHLEQAKQVILQDLNGYLISEKDNQLLVCKRN